MRLKPDTKNPRIVRDEMGNEMFVFSGLHLDDLREILSLVNGYEDWKDHAAKYGFNYSPQDKRFIEL